CCVPLLFISSSGETGFLYSFPTRRSSDLAHVAAGVSAVPPRPAARAGVAALDLERAPTPSMAGMESFLTIEQMARRAGLSAHARSEEHTSELQSRENLVCRLLLEKKKK